MMMKFLTTKSAAALMAALLLASAPALADGGFYVGGSVGGATLDGNLSDSEFPTLPSSIDEDDTAFKVFAGYTLDLPVIDLGVEAGYVDLGGGEIDLPPNTFGLQQFSYETTGINLWGIAALDAGPLNVFGKLGYISWDVEGAIDNLASASEDGTDMGYGLGISFELLGIQVRGEYEVYDIEDTDIEMLSVGIAFRF